MARSTSIVVIRAGLDQRVVQSNSVLLIRNAQTFLSIIRTGKFVSIGCSYQSGKYFVGKLVILDFGRDQQADAREGMTVESPQLCYLATYADINCIMIIINKYVVYNRFMKSTLSRMATCQTHVLLEPRPRCLDPQQTYIIPHALVHSTHPTHHRTVPGRLKSRATKLVGLVRKCTFRQVLRRSDTHCFAGR